ncbi:MAG: helix-turn-helix domain-containing protein, partial [Bacteroidetes bacterium]|nr:helix-turn-helix domain-containing protein [Bacteroidota bacterium]
QRSRAELYGADNVCLIGSEKKLNFLGWKFEGYAAEAGHLRRPARDDGASREQIMELHRRGSSLRQIAAELGVHFTTVHRVVKAAGEQAAVAVAEGS